MPPESAAENSVPFMEIFSQNPAISEYIEVHEEKQCVFCGNIFRKSSNLKIHIREVHAGLLQEK